MLIDTHCHLDAPEFDADRAQVLAAARTAGVRAFVVPAVQAAHFDDVAALAAAHADVHVAYGIHPLYVDGAQPADLDLLAARLDRGDALAVGEIGLDGYVPAADPQRQAHYFIEQLKLARRFDLPVILHIRRAQDAVLKQLRRIRVRGGIAHAFNGSRQQAEAFIGLGFKLGFGGAMTYDGSRRIRELAATLPLESIVLETDAPDMAPAWGARQRNEPANLARYAQVLADLRGIDVDTVVRATAANAHAALPALAD
ncbi:TatD family deoxyribonuclease [Pseudothauera nasutitermitis]|uniref:TatD family deoxyribonuclease n=1 Tax=Pseudothauera nasutitermitis TaxID=2565930 RepID=A0A4S4B0R3_9RHOO|nr:TatD family hydrolase [Pseudothauera nasutitermitis]THF66126.1 TatD family deoxyribonuclease [Pseudothauera nasutitermitis]